MSPALMCLALTIYFEARSEPIFGQIAVAQVVMRRVKDIRWPNTVCEVVWQTKQFSFTHDGKSDTPKDKKAWRTSRALAQATLNGGFQDFSQGANHYHAKEVKPYWISKLKYQITIGNHIFYR